MKHNIKLWIEKEKLRLNIADKILETDKWRFEKEHGGAIHIIAEYPSITRREGKIKLKYQIKNGEAHIYIQEQRTGRKRDVPYEIIQIRSTDSGIVINYKHGKKSKATIIFREENSVILNRRVIIAPDDIVFKSMKELVIGNYNLDRYEFNFTNEKIQQEIDLRAIVSYYFISQPEMGLNKIGRDIRDQIGKSIVTAFLKKLGYEKIIIDPIENEEFRESFPYIKPDILAGKEDNYAVIEVKYRFNRRQAITAFYDAYNQVLRHYNVLRSKDLFMLKSERINIVDFGIALVGYDHRRKSGYLYLFFGKHTL